MMLTINNNSKNRRYSSHNFANRLRCASAHCEQIEATQSATPANRTRRSLEKSLYSKITGWGLATLAIFGAFSYLIFIPEQAFAVDEIVDPDEHRSLSQINTMQEMSKQICINSRNEESKQLEDTRDGKKYWVTKLADGNCWMTQNLAYGTVSDISIGTPCKLSGTSNGATCTDNTSWANSDAAKHFAIGKHTEDNKSAHTSQGNFYNWPAATQGGSGDGVQGVCPSGWQLPTSGSGNTNNRSFGGLINAYSISAGSKLLEKPLHFQYGGHVYDGQLDSVGNYGGYWSSTPYTSDTTNAYNLYFYSSYVGPFSNSIRDYGYPIRCLAEGGWLDSYPDPVEPSDNQANVAITVSPVISIDVTKDANDMTVDFTKVATSTIIARVGSNQPYQVLLSTDKSDLTNPKTNQTIPMVPSDQTIVKGTNSWGIKKLNSPTDTEVNENTTYSPVGINGNKELFYTSDSAASEDLTFPVAIAVDSSLPSGQYSTQVTLTAVAM